MDVLDERNKIVKSLIDDYRQKSAEGLLPYEGLWLEYANIEQLVKDKIRHDRVVVGEIFMLFIMLFLMSSVFVLLIVALCY